MCVFNVRVSNDYFLTDYLKPIGHFNFNSVYLDNNVVFKY